MVARKLKAILVIQIQTLLPIKGGIIMAAYLAMRIECGKLSYNKVVKKYPKYKDDIDEILAADGYEIDENGKCVKYNTSEDETTAE